MRELKQDTYKGTRIIIGNDIRFTINLVTEYLIAMGFEEIQIPIIQPSHLYDNKVGQENNNLMYKFKDRGNRNICLAPEYTAVIQNLANTELKHERDMKLFYILPCFRGEKPQRGRYRQFTQLGVEIVNPTKNHERYVAELAMNLCKIVDARKVYHMNRYASRGLDYYDNGIGFEITCNTLGSSKQVCGGGSYQGGIGFAIGLDRLML